jgi:signal transduction histidine kinase
MIGDAQSATADAPATRRILLVDDDPEIRESLSSLLTDEGYEVSTSHDGRQALTLLRSNPADLIILDLRMPVMDGWQFRTLQRADPQLAEIPVLAVSADGSAQAAAIHAEHYLRKPFKADELLLAVERILLGRERRQLSVRLRHAERIALLGTIAASVGHEINNPLTYVLGNLDALRAALTGLPSEAATLLDARSLLADVTAGAERIREVVASLRWLSRPRTDSHRAVDLARVLETSMAIALTEVRHRARLDKRVGPLPLIPGDEARLGQVFVNLLVNAAQAIPAGSIDLNRITVTAEVRGPFVAVEVADTGAGITPELRARVFEPFFTTKDAASGTGLGLAISQNIVQEHGGRIELESTPGRGSLFRVLLPLTAPALPSPMPDVPAAPAAEPVAPLRVLVIDDDDLVLTTIQRMLRGDHLATAVPTAVQALDLLRAGRRFDVVLCDLMMPQMTGMAFHREVEALDPSLAPGIVYMTGGAFAPEAREFLNRIGPAACLEKPFTPEALRSALAAAARAAPEPS